MSSREVYPVIILPGINHSPSYLYDSSGSRRLDCSGREIGGTLMIPDTASAKAALPALIKALSASAVTKKECGIYDRAYECAMALTDYQRCNPEGDYIEDLRVERWEYPISEMTPERKAWVYRMVPLNALADEIGEDKIFFYTFNLVGDPLISAGELKDYISLVKSRTGSEKVTLVPVSLGGTILTAYLELYGFEDIGRITNIVACLDGTDIAADLFAREFDVSDKFLRHEFLPEIFEEETGSAAPGYAVNILMHLLPRKGFNALLSGFVSGLLDGLILNCPQIWAMLPSYRYDSLKRRYLTEGTRLCERTDVFQRARLNLKDNLLKAREAGVKIDFISGSGIDFGDIQYSYFHAVSSRSKYNTDGIINLSSTTLGAHGAPRGKRLPDGYTCKGNPLYPGYDYISPDGRVDVSSALMPDNTWIFLNQHHEVGNNSAVLNLAKSIIAGEVEDVHTDPARFPQFNGTANTYHLRRWRLNDGKIALEKIRSGEIVTAKSVASALEHGVKRGEEVLRGTLGNAHEAAKVKAQLDDILIRLGELTPEKKRRQIEIIIEKALSHISKALIRRKP